jgi:hypothetical protein
MDISDHHVRADADEAAVECQRVAHDDDAGAAGASYIERRVATATTATTTSIGGSRLTGPISIRPIPATVYATARSICGIFAPSATTTAIIDG